MRYPSDWPAISRHIRFERAGGRCEFVLETGARCSAMQGQPHPLTGSIVVLTVAHLDHMPENCADGNLLAACQRCHNRYDMPHRRAGIRQRARAGLAVCELFEKST